MHVLFESSITDEIRQKYIVLSLDTFRFESTGITETAYCLVENAPITEMMYIDRWQKLHSKLIENFKQQNWSFCEDAIEHLQGRWGGEVDSFYQELSKRIAYLKNEELDDEWTGVIVKN